MKKNILPSLAVFLGLATLSQGAMSSILLVKRDVYIPAVNRDPHKMKHVDSVADLKNLALEDFQGNPSFMAKPITSDSIVVKRSDAPLQYARPIDEAELASINRALSNNEEVYIEVTAAPDALLTTGRRVSQLRHGVGR